MEREPVGWMASRGGESAVRAPFAVAAWAAATAVAAVVAWLGVDSVLIPAAETPPAVLAAGAGQSSAAPAAAAPSVAASPTPSPSATTAHVPVVPPSRTPSASASPSPSASSKTSRYDTGGGVVVLAIGSNTVSLVSATPAAGFSVRNWSAAGWLRVDFTEGSTVYSVYATWNGYSPQVQVVGPNG